MMKEWYTCYRGRMAIVYREGIHGHRSTRAPWSFIKVSKTAMVTIGTMIMTVVQSHNGYSHRAPTNIIDHWCFLRVCIFETPRVGFFTNRGVSDPKTTSSLCAIRHEVNEQLIPTGREVSRQIAATECVDQLSGGVFSVINFNVVAATWEREIEEVQAHTL